MLVNQGHSASAVASWFGDDPSSVARWVRHYQEFGCHGLHEDQRSGRPTKLGFDQLSTLETDLLESPQSFGYDQAAWNGSLLKVHVERRFSVELSVRQCQRLLRRLQSPETTSATASRQCD